MVGTKQVHPGEQLIPLNEFEDVLHLINPMGRWQIAIYVLVAILQVFFAAINLAFTFMQITPDFACRLPIQSTRWNVAQIKNISSPLKYIGSKYERDACYSYEDLPYQNLINMSYDEAFNRAQQLQNSSDYSNCTNGWVYNTSVNMQNTLATQFDLVCDKKLYVEHSQLVYMGGFFVGSLVSGILSDKFGRRTVLVLMAVIGSVCAVGTSFAPSFLIFVLIRFVLAFCGIASTMASFCLALEVTTSKWRIWVGGLFFIPYALGYTLLPLFAFFLRDWRYMHLAISLPTLLAFIYWWLISESPRWLLVSQRLDEAEKEIRRAAKINRRQIPRDLHLKKIAHAATREEEVERAKNVNILTIFKVRNYRLQYPTLTARALNIFFNWFVNSMVYYGVSLNVSSFAGDVFLNNAIAGAVEFPGYMICVPLLYWGRNKGLFSTLLMAGICLFIVPWISDSMNWLKLLLAMTGKLCITSSFAIVYVYTTELYPTVIRNSGLATSSCIARIGSMLAPYISSIGKISPSIAWMPMLIFGSFSIAAAILTLFLPETLNKSLPDTIEDAVHQHDHDDDKAKIEMTPVKQFKLETRF